jgi:CheY-like chemotaxis protein
VSPKKKPEKTKAKPKAAPKVKKAAKPVKKAPPAKAKTAKPVKKAATNKPTPAPKKSQRHEAVRPNHAPPPLPKTAKTTTVTAKKVPIEKAAKLPEPKITAAATKPATVPGSAPAPTAIKAPAPAPAPKPAPKTSRTTLDDLPLDIDEKDELLEEEKRDLAKALRDDEDEPLETAFVPTDTSERFILVVDEEGQRRTETVTIVQQILPNAVVEVADDPEEAFEVMQEADFDTYVVNFLMPGYSASPFVKAVANHPDHPLLIGFAADKISDALDQRKGLKIIPLKRLFDLDVNTDAAKDKSGGAED